MGRAGLVDRKGNWDWGAMILRFGGMRAVGGLGRRRRGGRCALEGGIVGRGR